MHLRVFVAAINAAIRTNVKVCLRYMAASRQVSLATARVAAAAATATAAAANELVHSAIHPDVNSCR